MPASFDLEKIELHFVIHPDTPYINMAPKDVVLHENRGDIKEMSLFLTKEQKVWDFVVAKFFTGHL